MKTLIAIFSTAALMFSIGSSEASAENFFKKVSRGIKKAHERHVDILEDAHDRHVDILRHGARIYAGQRGYGAGCGRYETVEVQNWVPGYETIEYVEVHEPGHYEFRRVTEIVTPARCERFYVAPVFRIERDHCGNQVRIMVKAGYWTTREIPAVTCTKTVKFWVEGECKRVAKRVCVPGHYETKCVRVWVCD
ncbi:MAG: hypothetical protein AAB074_09945 [Planctomycetota bacterium]|mgnify:CR=1 FL=1